MFNSRRTFLLLGTFFLASPSQGQTSSAESFLGTWESVVRKALLVIERTEGPVIVGKFTDGGTEPLGAQWIKGKQGSARVDNGVLKTTLQNGNNLELVLSPDGKALSGQVFSVTRTVG